MVLTAILFMFSWWSYSIVRAGEAGEWRYMIGNLVLFTIVGEVFACWFLSTYCDYRMVI